MRNAVNHLTECGNQYNFTGAAGIWSAGTLQDVKSIVQTVQETCHPPAMTDDYIHKNIPSKWLRYDIINHVQHIAARGYDNADGGFGYQVMPGERNSDGRSLSLSRFG